jgi:membrane protein
VLIWVYYSSQIILMGAEFTHAFANQHGSKKVGKPQQKQPASRSALS